MQKDQFIEEEVKRIIKLKDEVDLNNGNVPNYHLVDKHELTRAEDE